MKADFSANGYRHSAITTDWRIGLRSKLSPPENSRPGDI
jgi:hypothetical protein